ncbi:calcium-binding protein, putative [Plasmodium vivax]|uniref:Calcium-binding protein, putative n=6 Tax=Plasmodium vivax TaxID=5855 RepID=A5K1Q2_PLAVS|nr:calcium-binding protein, putative [Plasmodium vivax]KMZ79400.1 calcium-binding protein [Plasmodium vivax India VII]KMZ85786.1 calcium-binding protein [Plasmodium vivax Brazil I]KMZ92260.1 calcium-binding protein [Plasmodium vivax Mauritania I]KMZ98495.1 calcium-binding protein [Plasmodium vivax North Korean]EDL46352.1 calcium-binding protein, putative [Plasmodium vivax]|eukprot:XP_001616079.1 calcium-binding protein [Plasmodium vivax Sal-1]
MEEHHRGGKKNESSYKFLNADEINNLEYIFNKMKRSKNESVTIQNVQKFLHANHNKDISDDLLDLFHMYGTTITLEDFLTSLNCDINKFKSKEKMKSLFNLLDASNRGYISTRSFIQAAKEFENEFSEETLRSIFNIMDLSSSDRMHFDEFKNAIANM